MKRAPEAVKQKKRKWNGMSVNLGMMVVPVTGPEMLCDPTVEGERFDTSPGSLLRVWLSFLTRKPPRGDRQWPALPHLPDRDGQK
jgi:hypothetical protein